MNWVRAVFNVLGAVAATATATAVFISAFWLMIEYPDAFIVICLVLTFCAAVCFEKGLIDKREWKQRGQR